MNSKRSTCEQAGKGIMMKELKRFKEDGMDRFTIDELQKIQKGRKKHSPGSTAHFLSLSAA